MSGESPWQMVLASASPARRRLLQNAGIEPIVRPSDFDESQVQLTDPAELVQVLASHKAERVMQLLWEQERFSWLFCPAPRGVILGCDSVLVVGGEIHGKPAHAAEAIDRWQHMRGQVGELYTGHALWHPHTENGILTPLPPTVRCQVTKVYFASVTDAEIAAYVATGEPLNCAGCFALEGRGGFFVEKLDGCHSNVIGLSLPLLRQMVREHGIEVTDFWLANTV